MILLDIVCWLSHCFIPNRLMMFRFLIHFATLVDAELIECELRRDDVIWVPYAADHFVCSCLVMKRYKIRIMTFINPHRWVCYLLGLIGTKLHVKVEFNCHVWPCGYSGNHLEILAKEGVADSWVCRVWDLLVHWCNCSCCVGIKELVVVSIEHPFWFFKERSILASEKIPKCAKINRLWTRTRSHSLKLIKNISTTLSMIFNPLRV